MSDEFLVKCENVSKKFCLNLKQSLWYGVQDICSELNPFKEKHNFIKASHLSKLREKEFWAVNNISFNLKRGECIGLIGHNGAGKSTILRILNGLIKPDHGKITINGCIGAMIELNVGFNPVLTGRENVYIYGSILGFSKKKINNKYDDIVKFAELEDFMEMPFRSYSSGMKVRLGFAVAAQMEPDVLIIDEVLAVGDIGFRAKCYNTISNLLNNTAIIFVSHSMPEIARLCTQIILLDKGYCKYIGHDTAKGINLYYSSFKKPSGAIIKSKDAEFLKISINGQDNNECPTISFNNDLNFQIKAYVNSKIINPIFHIALLSQSLQNICHCSSAYSHINFTSLDEIINLKTTIQKINLTPGIYYIDFAITDSLNIKILARTHLYHQIQVTGDFTGYGTTLSIGDWKQINN